MDGSRRTADPDPRQKIIEASLRLLEEGGTEALQARRIGAEIGASTMAVYTYFGGMHRLLEAIVAEALARFSAALEAATASDDPVADLFRMSHAYRQYALASPHRYRLMFRLATPPKPGPKPTVSADRATLPVGDTGFDGLIRTVERIIAAERIRDRPATDVAGRVWGLTHGMVMLELAGYLGSDGPSVAHALDATMLDLLVGMGDDRDRATRSWARAVADIEHTRVADD
ncbi:TetR/AcrR family transcriptional regulator [Nocardia sp. NBC_01009]|uniref:TetR/AcrR family transcriptional regulator n=1 Tax=Nocardia sp. NBC_01009 TaxID=2975996 RepID=UPI0038650C04|nr:WHG domain-containing protein [Nocardia sp. NBC_01009]